MLQRGTVQHLFLFRTGFLRVSGHKLIKSVDLLDLICCPCFWGVKGVSAGLAQFDGTKKDTPFLSRQFMYQLSVLHLLFTL